MNDAALIAATRDCAAAQASQERTGTALRHAEAQAQRVAERLLAVEADRALIVTRRAAGDQRPDDGALLALAAADLEGLKMLLGDADSVVATASGQHETATRILAVAEYSVEHVKNAIIEGSLVEFATRLDEAMQFAIGELEAVSARLGRTGRPVWSASPALYAKVRALAALRGEL